MDLRGQQTQPAPESFPPADPEEPVSTASVFTEESGNAYLLFWLYAEEQSGAEPLVDAFLFRH